MNTTAPTLRSRLSALACASALTLLSGCGQPASSDSTTPATDSAMADASAPSLDSTDQRVSYGIAHNLGANIASQGGLEVDTAAFLAGLRDGLAGKEPRLPESDLRAAFQDVQQRAAGAAQAAATKNAAAAEDFLATNAQRPGVTTTASGLQYEVIRRGDGPKPKPSDTVEVHYHGTLVDGTVFDSSVQRGETISFPVTGVIQGWVEALQLMSVGDKWRLFIPPGLGYGNRATGKIPAGSALIFEVELISIK